MEDWLGITKIENDATGRAVKVRYPDGKEVSYTYGKSGERTGMTYPDGREVAYTYDSQLRLSGLKDGNDTIAYSYDEIGRLARKTFPNGTETSYAYNAEGHLAELTHRDREGILDRYVYGYDLMGNRTAMEKHRRGLPEESGSYTYAYDALGRLAGASRDGQNLRTYEYDAFGNRTRLKEGDTETVYAYNAMNQLVSRADSVNEETYAYDKRGNLSFIMENGVLKNWYTYGALNRLEQAAGGKGEAVSYTYNGLGFRVGKTAGTIAGPDGARGASGEMTVPDPSSSLKEQTVHPETRIQYTADLTRQYHNLLQKEESGITQTFLWDGNVAGMAEGDSACSMYFFQDELGSQVRLTDQDGELAESYGYDEFGQNLYGNQGLVQPFGYTGYQMDRTAGTYFAQAREYRPELGRFAAADTVKGFAAEPYTLNEYGYCWNRPLDLVDLNGMLPTAGVTDALYGTDTPEKKEDPVHGLKDNYSDWKKRKSLAETGSRTFKWYKDYKETKSLKKTLKTAQITEEMAAREGISLGRYRRVTRANIKNGMKSMEELGNAAKSGSRFGGADVLGIGIDVGVGIYDNYQSGASAAEYVSDAAVDVTLSTGESVASAAVATVTATVTTSMLAGTTIGSAVPGLGNIVGAVFGLIVGLALAYADSYDYNGNGKSLRDDLKDWVYGKISGGNDEKE